MDYLFMDGNIGMNLLCTCVGQGALYCNHYCRKRCDVKCNSYIK